MAPGSTYNFTSGHAAVIGITPNLPLSKLKADSVCKGYVKLLAGSPAGGTWTSSNTSVATIGTTGIVTGVAVGTATISYSMSNSCGTLYSTATIKILNPSTTAAG